MTQAGHAVHLVSYPPAGLLLAAVRTAIAGAARQRPVRESQARGNGVTEG